MLPVFVGARWMEVQRKEWWQFLHRILYRMPPPSSYDTHLSPHFEFKFTKGSRVLGVFSASREELFFRSLGLVAPLVYSASPLSFLPPSHSVCLWWNPLMQPLLISNSLCSKRCLMLLLPAKFWIIRVPYHSRWMQCWGSKPWGFHAF